MTLKAVAAGWDTQIDWLALRHESCAGRWRVDVGSVFLRLAVRCPACGETDTIEPHELVACFLAGTPPLSADEADRVDAAAAERTMTWYRGLEGLEPLGALVEFRVFPIFLGVG